MYYPSLEVIDIDVQAGKGELQRHAISHLVQTQDQFILSADQNSILCIVTCVHPCSPRQQGEIQVVQRRVTSKTVLP